MARVPKKILPKKDISDERHYPSRPVVGVGVVIWRGDKVLLVKRAYAPRKDEWGLPGGMQNLGETIMEAAVREAREETGLDITPLGIITALDVLVPDKKGALEYHYTLIEVAADAGQDEDGGKKARAGSDAKELRWATLEDVEKLCAWPEVARVVQQSLLQKAL